MQEGRKNMFWGVFFLILGVLLLLNYVFGIHLPIMKILFACLLIYLGFSMLFGTFNINVTGKKKSTEHEAVFSRSTFKYPTTEKFERDGYVTAFAESELDLTAVDVSTSPKLEMTVAFGSSHVRVKKGTPLRVETTTAFGQTKLPEKNISAFGEFTYRSPGLSNEQPALIIVSTVAFGQLEIEEVP